MNEEENILRKILEKLELIRTLNIKGNMSPHKFIFLLMIAKLYDEDPSRENCFYLNDSLENKYVIIWTEKYPGIKHGNIFIEYPFYHLSNDGVWNVKIKATKREIYNHFIENSNPRFTKKKLKEMVEFGYLDSQIDKSLRYYNSRTKMIEWLENKISNISYLVNSEMDEALKYIAENS